MKNLLTAALFTLGLSLLVACGGPDEDYDVGGDQSIEQSDVSDENLAETVDYLQGQCGDNSVGQCIGKVEGQWCPMGTRSGTCRRAPNCACVVTCSGRGCGR